MFNLASPHEGSQDPGECYYLGMKGINSWAVSGQTTAVLPDDVNTAGFVLVGGRSSRMGRDKALLPSGSGTLVKEIADSVAAVSGNVALIGRPESYRSLGYDCLEDICPGLGPLSGIHTALHSS